MVSILIPAYNAERFLKRCLDSVLGQTYRELEVIIVNDGSKDGTLDLCHEYEKLDSRVKVINQRNGGVAAARNVALEAATGEYILFVDADDWIELDMIELMLGALCRFENADVAFCRHDFAEKTKEVNRAQDTHEIELWSRTKQQLEFMHHRRMTGMLWNKLIRRDLFDEIWFDETVCYGEDAQILWEVLKKSRNMVVIDETLYHHVMEYESISHQQYSPRKFTSVKVWEEIGKDIKLYYSQWVSLVQERQIENATVLCYEMKMSGYKNLEEKRVLHKTISRNWKCIFRKNGMSVKMRLYAIGILLKIL